MYDFLHTLMQDKTGEPLFALYNIWHILIIIILAGIIVFISLFFRKKSVDTREKVLNILISSALFLYILDLFCMPFSCGYIDVDKLPFHVCTLMSVACFMSRHNRIVGKCKTSFTLLGLIGAFMYIVCPSGVADGTVSIFSYRIIQTLLYHGLMVTYGVCSLVFGDVKLKWKECYKELIVIACMVIYSVTGNILYKGIEDGREFNWFFVRSDPLGIIPTDIAPYVMPFVILVVFFVLVMLVYFVYHLVINIAEKRTLKQ